MIWSGCSVVLAVNLELCLGSLSSDELCLGG